MRVSRPPSPSHTRRPKPTWPATRAAASSDPRARGGARGSVTRGASEAPAGWHAAPVHGDELDMRLTALALQWQGGDEAAFNELARAVLPLLHRMGRVRVADRDLVQQFADDAVLRAADTFDPTRGKAFTGYLALKWSGVFSSYFRSRSSRPGGVVQPPTDPETRLPRRLGLSELSAVGPDRLPYDDPVPIEREWLLRWKPVSDKVLGEIDSIADDKRRIGLRRALQVVCLRSLGCPFSDSELSRDLGCDPKQAGRYVAAVHTMLRPYFDDREGQR